VKNFLLVGVSLASLAMSHAEAEDKPAPPAQERIELAKQTYRGRILYGLERRSDPPRTPAGLSEEPLLNEAMAEDLHKWSVRWMEAECDAAADRAGRVAAAQAHLDRMKSIEAGRMARKELADHPFVKELDQRKSPLVDLDVQEMRKVWDQLAITSQRYPEVARYFRLEAEARLAKERDGR
jgi:hypothetical protein